MSDTAAPSAPHAYTLTATMRAADRLARRQREAAQYGCLPGESVIDAICRQRDPLSGTGLGGADQQAIIVARRSEYEEQIDALLRLNGELMADHDTHRQMLSEAHELVDSLQTQLAALRTEAEFDFSARCALHSQVCRYGQALTLIANLPIAEDGYRAAEELRVARRLAETAYKAEPAANGRDVLGDGQTS